MGELTQQTGQLTASDIRANVNLIQQVLTDIMKKDVHYGVIPGCKKPTLYKAGSEKILSTFRLSIKPIVEDLSTADESRYRVTTEVIHIPSGNFVGMGVGSCSSEEEKYKWRKAVCESEYEATPENRRREKWVKPYNGEEYTVKQVRASVADIDNTILKMAKKRSQIDATLTATAASDIFEQDIEDLPEHYMENQEPVNAKPEVKPPQEKKPKGQQQGCITEAQGKRLYAIAMGKGVEDFSAWLVDQGYDRTNDIKTEHYEAIVKNAENYKK